MISRISRNLQRRNFATRGAAPESSPAQGHYPGTYIAGTYNRLRSEIAGRIVENESLVNVPSWLPLSFATDDGVAFHPDTTEVLDHRIELDLRRGVLTRRSRLREPSGRILAITQRRFVSVRDPHLAAVECTLAAEGWSGRLLVTSALDGRVTNDGVARYRSLPSDHLRPVEECFADEQTMCLEVETSDSHIRIAESARTRVFADGELVEVPRRPQAEPRYVAHHLDLDLVDGRPVTIEKVVAVFTSRDDGIYEPHRESERCATGAADFDELLDRHVLTWAHAWNRSRIDLDDPVDDTARVLDLHVFHLLQTTSKNTAELDVGVPARGLHGEAYRGHVFWDELFIFPFLSWRVPELTRALLRYRARRLDQARGLAREAGYRGAMYPWQSASNGREETQTLHLNPESGRWLPDASHLQRHIDAAIAYEVWSYWQVTADLEFMRFWGAEMMLEIARFWVSATTYDRLRDRYDIVGVVGPDEYHEGYPGADEPGLRNNAYTNLMAVWCVCRAFDVLALLPEQRRRELLEKLALTQEELDRWGDVSRKMTVCFHDDVISQFEGYGDLEELDWESYRSRYGNIGRLDRILEAEGDTPNRYKLSKQADTLMLFYLFSAEEVQQLIERLGYPYDADLIPRTISYYEARTSHGSTLSYVVHAWLHARGDRRQAWDLFRQALLADVADVQGGTTAEGIHLGAMAGTVDLVQRCFTGIETRHDRLVINPVLPDELDRLHFQVTYRRNTIDLTFTADRLVVQVLSDGDEARPIPMEIAGTAHRLQPGERLEVDLARPRR